MKFLKSIKSKFVLWLMSTRVYKYLLFHVIPYIRFTTYYTSMRGRTYHKLYNVVKPGHILLTNDSKKLTTLLIGGDFSHAAFVVSKDGDWEVSEMTHNNYTKSTVADLCFEADRVVVLECTKFDAAYTKKTIDKCKSFEGVAYDVQFEFGIEALSCAEMVYEADFERRLDANLEDVIGIGQLYISPTGLYNAKNVKVIFDTAAL